MKITVDLDSGSGVGAEPAVGAGSGGGAGPGGGAGSTTHGKDAADAVREVAALRARLKRSLFALAALCLLLAAAGFAFARWMMTLPPGTLKAP